MMAKPSYPTRWCSQCSVDWPQYPQYNLCPKCGRCTAADTSDVKPDETAARVLAAKYAAFDAWLAARNAALEQAFAAAPTIPDPSPTPPRRDQPYPTNEEMDNA
jgi:hypothetical protein